MLKAPLGSPKCSLCSNHTFHVIPWLQRELDAYRDRVNNTAKHADRNKVLPHSVPNHMYEAPEDFGVLDFKIKVDPAAIAYVRNLYAPPDHEVCELVPKDFAKPVTEFYAQIGNPLITRTNVWDIYMWGYSLTMACDDYEDDLALIPNLTPLHNGSEVVGPDGYYYMGGVNNGLGLNDEQLLQLDAMMDRDDPLPEGEMELVEGDQLVAWFSDEEEEPGDEIFD
ncbi:hypothetical protein C8F04DRAFT_1329403 [Mycena alexandri]|uniref:Uncharacterized protein n=1 Tax=Mycena alexandri TaxID=1745969 RepID=A0AAD6S0P5_9AGAR|nr:hypothetical protein C8F04DRAFT_1329403 [Mycena alexandri]